MALSLLEVLYWSTYSIIGVVEVERATYTIRNRGSLVAVEVWFDGRNRARLLVDGAETEAAETDSVGHADLGKGTDHHVRVVWWWRGRVARCALVESRETSDEADSDDTLPMPRRDVLTPLAPPPGTRAARRYEMAQRHPRLYAARHVVFKVGGFLVAALGIGALVRALLNGVLPRISFDWLPDIERPGWLKYLNPFWYLRRVFGWVPDLFAWLPDIDLPDGRWINYVVGVVVAIGVASEEVTRRRKRDEREAELSGEESATTEADDESPVGEKPSR